MREGDRDEGLVRAVGPWALAASIVNTVVGAGIFAVPGQLAACVGPWAPAVFLACAVAIGAVAACFAEGGSRVPTSGGPYGYVDAAFGPLAGYVAGAMLFASDVLACGGVAAAVADVAVASTGAHGGGATRAVVATVVLGAIALVNVAGVAWGARLVNVATAIKLVPLVVFVLVGATSARYAGLAAGTYAGGAGLGRAAILALFTFSGMEAALGASGEVREPSRTIPRALGLAMVFVTALYVAIQLVAEGNLGVALAGSATPLADAMTEAHARLRPLLLAGAAISMLGWIGSDVLGTPQVLFAFARDGWLPRALGRVHPRTRAPYVAILVYAAIALILAATGTFAELAVLSTLALAPVYIGGCAAAWVLQRRGEARAGTPLGFRGIGVAACIGTGAMVAAVALASREEQLGLVALLASTSLVYAAQSRRRRSQAAEPGTS